MSNLSNESFTSNTEDSEYIANLEKKDNIIIELSNCEYTINKLNDLMEEKDKKIKELSKYKNSDIDERLKLKDEEIKNLNKELEEERYHVKLYYDILSKASDIINSVV